MGSLCNPLWFPLADLICLLASQPTKNCGLWSKGHLGTTGHVITVVFAIAFCHAMFGVEVCVGVGDGDVGEILLVVVLFQYVRDKVRISDSLLNNQDSLCLVFPFLVKMAILLSAITDHIVYQTPWQWKSDRQNQEVLVVLIFSRRSLFCWR